MFRHWAMKKGISVVEKNYYDKVYSQISTYWNDRTTFLNDSNTQNDSNNAKEPFPGLISLTPLNEFDYDLSQTPPKLIGIKEYPLDHIIYAYLIENTGIYEVFCKLITDFRFGGKLVTPSLASMKWIETAENLIFNDNQMFAPHQIATTIRPNSGSVRRNAYYRMFGMDLNHGPFNYTKPMIANREFVSTFENFLKEVWVGLANVNNRVASDQTDNEAIRDFAQRLRDMLRAKRLSGYDEKTKANSYDNLKKEEFHAVTILSFLHMSISGNNISIIKDLRAIGETESERLAKLSAITGIPVHTKSHTFFELAIPMSTILRLIESNGIEFTTDNAPIFYNKNIGKFTDLPEIMRKLINNWSVVTGKNMKVKAKLM